MPIITVFVVAGFLGILVIYRMRRLLGAAAISAVGGIAAIGLINVTGFLTGITLPFNLFSLLVSVALGAPGVISLLLMQMFW
ncbi:MAG: pro-sigmaK processing inhibitor BofA family protein [Angelakisella sp.]